MKSKKILLIAAIISILVAILTVTSIAFEWNIFDELKNRFGTVADVPVNKEIDVNNITIISNGKNSKYKSLEEFFEKENINILFFKKIPDNITLEKIVIDEFEGENRIAFAFSNSDLTFSVMFNKEISNETKEVSTEIITINYNICYIIEMKDINLTQVYFEYNGNLYKLTYNNKQDLIKLIENLKEFKNEN